MPRKRLVKWRRNRTKIVCNQNKSNVSSSLSCFPTPLPPHPPLGVLLHIHSSNTGHENRGTDIRCVGVVTCFCTQYHACLRRDVVEDDLLPLSATDRRALVLALEHHGVSAANVVTVCNILAPCLRKVHDLSVFISQHNKKAPRARILSKDSTPLTQKQKNLAHN